ncbi:MAG: hypothetical protein IPK70_09480 [Flavobacteriales bacterium]|nr:hypothetical protein [Flavobacteriales bacterium]
MKLSTRLKAQGQGSRPFAAISLLLLAPSAIAQQKPFSSDQALFLQEVSAFMVTVDKKEGKPFMEEVFAPAWNGAYFSERQRIKVAEVANFMLKKRFDAFPGFRDYLDCVAAFPATGRNATDSMRGCRAWTSWCKARASRTCRPS